MSRTSQERATIALNMAGGAWDADDDAYIDRVADAIEAAVLEEREAILAIVEREHECRCFGRIQGPPDLCDGCKKNALRKEIAAAIRAGK